MERIHIALDEEILIIEYWRDALAVVEDVHVQLSLKT